MSDMYDVKYVSDLERRAFKVRYLCGNVELAFDQYSHAKVVSNADAKQDLIIHNLKRECGSIRDTSTNCGVRRVLVEPIEFGTKHEL